ncbi:hypothetical protein ACFL35_21675 [Candidatus Riflebacteria bacterium]
MSPKNTRTMIKILVFFGIPLAIILLLYFANPLAYFHEKMEEEKKINICKANVMTLAGAVEMYNIRFNSKLEKLDVELLRKRHLLTKSHDYQCPLGGKYSILEKIYVHCSKHAENKIPISQSRDAGFFRL